MNDPLYSHLCLPEPCQVALYEIDEALSFLAAQRNHLLNSSPDITGLPAFSVALDTFDAAFQAFIEQQQWEEKKEADGNTKSHHCRDGKAGA